MDGKKKMLQTWGHILNGLCDILKNDPKIRPDAVSYTHLAAINGDFEQADLIK